MIDRSKLTNSFEFVVVAGARARQLMRGAQPRVTASTKPVTTAQREVLGGAVAPETEQGAAEVAPPSPGGERAAENR
ncbi:MAG: DNA-directed RNA polymerase subunit omega [Acidobacteria bacterium]|nr:DNA-directed RNA polymerase subunit omega [Acidobacteriota bacterium]MBI3263677.1 DNA-directed RNA polymerase subunit omega [Acidobacteriota bacterium]